MKVHRGNKWKNHQSLSSFSSFEISRSQFLPNNFPPPKKPQPCVFFLCVCEVFKPESGYGFIENEVCGWDGWLVHNDSRHVRLESKNLWRLLFLLLGFTNRQIFLVGVLNVEKVREFGWEGAAMV